MLVFMIKSKRGRRKKSIITGQEHWVFIENCFVRVSPRTRGEL